MKRTVMCFLIALFVMTLSIASAETQLIMLDAKLEILAGQVKLTRVGSTKTDVISRSCQLYAGDLLETLKDSRTVLTYSDGTTMRVKERTLIEVQPMSVRVFKGKTWYKFTKRGTEFKIETPSLVAGIRGTEFEVAVTSRQKTVVSVMEGAVAANSKAGGDTEVLKMGEAVSCEKDKALSSKCSFDVESKLAEWNSNEWQEVAGTDLNSLFLEFMNLRNEFGPDDPRTMEAKAAFDKASAEAKKSASKKVKKAK